LLPAFLPEEYSVELRDFLELTCGQVFLVFLGGLIAFLVIGVILFIALFKLWFELLKAYIYILIDVVLAPFWIMGSLIPGSPMNVSGWLKDLAANLLHFRSQSECSCWDKYF